MGRFLITLGICVIILFSIFNILKFIRLLNISGIICIILTLKSNSSNFNNNLNSLGIVLILLFDKYNFLRLIKLKIFGNSSNLQFFKLKYSICDIFPILIKKGESISKSILFNVNSFKN